MFNNLFGVELSYIAQFFLAFVIVLGLIAATFWLLRRFGGNRLTGEKAKGRQPRLAVIDAAAVDSRRRLILIRRDNVEHLMMIGGPSDVVIEQNIVRAVPVAPAREAPPTRGPGETVMRGTDMVRPDSVPRAAAPDANWSPPPLPEGIRPRAEPAMRTSEPARPLPESILPPRMPMPEPRAPRGSAELAQVEVRQSPPTSDVNLADMAQRLEAALRRPGQAPEARAEPPPRPMPPPRPTGPPRTVAAPETIMPPIPRVTPPRPVAPPPSAAPSTPPPSAAPPSLPQFSPPQSSQPQPSSPPPASAAPPSVAPPSAPPPAPEPVRAPEPAAMQAPPQPPPASAEAPEPKPEPAPAKPKTVFDSLEEEMASLLGRPPDKT